MVRPSVSALLLTVSTTLLCRIDDDAFVTEASSSSSGHQRNRRFAYWLSKKKKLVLPPGTQLILTPTLAMPLIRYPPEGIDANLTISTPFTSKLRGWRTRSPS